jgi:hypothetical protein
MDENPLNGWKSENENKNENLDKFILAFNMSPMF